MRLGSIEFVLKLKDDFSKGLKKVSTQAKKTSTSISNKFKKMSLGIKAAWVAVGYVVIKIFKDMIFMTQQAELAQARLEQQFKNVGIASEENFKAVKKLANELQRKTGISNDEIISSAALASSYNLNFEQIMKLLPAMTDLTAFTAKSTGAQAKMEDQVKLMGYVLEGQVGRLKLMGITMTDAQKEMIATGDSAERLAVFLEAIEQNAGGVAEAMGETATGQMGIFRAEIDDFLKSVGGPLIKFLGAVAGGYNWLFKSMSASIEKNKEFKDGIDKLQSFLKNGIITQEEYNELLEEYNDILGKRISSKEVLNFEEELNETIKEGNIQLRIRAELLRLEQDALVQYYKEKLDLLDQDIAKTKEGSKENIKLRVTKIRILETIKDETKALKKGNTEQEKMIASVAEARATIEELNSIQADRIELTEEQNNKLEEAVEINIRYGEEVDLLNDKVETGLNLYSLLNDSLSINKKELQDVTLRIIRNGDATGELTKRKQELIETIKLETSEFNLVKDVMDEVNNSLKETNRITEMSMTSFDNLRQKLESQIEAIQQYIDTEGQIGQQGTQEDIDNIAERLENLENGNWNAVKAAQELNKETGDNFVVANKINKKAAAELDIRLNTLTTTTQGFIDKLKEAQTELTNLNNMPLEDKNATWTITIRKRGGGGGVGEGEGE